MALDNNKTAIIRSHKNSYAKNHNQRSGAFLESVLGNEPDVIEGQDSGEVTKPKSILKDWVLPHLKSELKKQNLVNDEIERIEESIKTGQEIIY